MFLYHYCSAQKHFIFRTSCNKQDNHRRVHSHNNMLPPSLGFLSKSSHTCVVAVIRRVEDVGVVQLFYTLHFFDYHLHQVVHRQQRLPPAERLLLMCAQRKSSLCVAGSSAAAPSPESIIQEGDGAVGHGVDRLTQQPVFVLKRTQIHSEVEFKAVIKPDVSSVAPTFPGLLKLPPRGALTSPNMFWYWGAAVQGEWGAGGDSIRRKGRRGFLSSRKRSDRFA